jgi:hypothetical protein
MLDWFLKNTDVAAKDSFGYLVEKFENVCIPYKELDLWYQKRASCPNIAFQCGRNEEEVRPSRTKQMQDFAIIPSVPESFTVQPASYFCSS